MPNASSNLLDNLRDALADVDAGSLRRRRKLAESPCAPVVSLNGRSVLAFASNDYLGLANHPGLIEAAAEGARRWGVGAGASHLVSGHSAVHEALETELARFVGCEASLVFSTGYMANIAVMPALLGRGDEIFADRLNHASLVDGALLSRATMHRYAHSDMQALARLLAASQARRKLIVSDAVFSMDGDIAPLAELLALAEHYDAWLLIDDAHGFGVLGPQGRGSLAEANLRSERIILMGTLGKAAGVSGAFVAGSQVLIDWLVQKSRAYIFTTAMSPMLAHVLLSSLELIENADDRRQHLRGLVTRFREGMAMHAQCLLPSRTAIQPVVIGDNTNTVNIAAALLERDIWVPAIRPPTVPVGSARLRISLSAAHTQAQVDQLVSSLASELDAAPARPG
ncbi:8-amino-7-oxononanoate synthase [Uliginosibacterium sp. H3]|uniref:8-amino-7-oxononanoate synthase n=1 Tax=Uliginosibacterium silvisoli TaxID=3114758 RepID=A0ABU6K7T0_9RHOO|nr:8-amino-7-oxononanoate synthase [Uliginosibacterium sp. H3]